LPIIVSFSYIYISQDSAERPSGCDETFHNHVIANCSQSVQVKNFLKSINIFGENMHNNKAGRFLRHGVYGSDL